MATGDFRYLFRDLFQPADAVVALTALALTAAYVYRVYRRFYGTAAP